jgi:hypothetical protein
LTFTRYRPAIDLDYKAEVASTLPGGWKPLSDVFSVVPNPNGLTEAAALRDALSATKRSGSIGRTRG